MHDLFLFRPPLNLLRQELAGTCIYMDILQKITATVDVQKEEDIKEDKLEGIAEGKLVSFCEQVLREASEFQSSMEEASNMDVHRVLELRSPIIIKVQVISDSFKMCYIPESFVSKMQEKPQLFIRGFIITLQGVSVFLVQNNEA